MIVRLASERRKLHGAVKECTESLQNYCRTLLAPAAVLRIEQKFFLDVGADQWLVGAATHVRLPLFHHRAVAQRCTDMAGEIFWIGILRIDAVAHFFGKRDDA